MISCIGVDGIGVLMMPLSVPGVAVTIVGVTSSVGGLMVWVGDDRKNGVHVGGTVGIGSFVPSRRAISVSSKVGTDVNVGGNVLVGVNVFVDVGVAVGVMVGNGVDVGVSVSVAVGVAVGVFVNIRVGVGTGVLV